MVQRPRPTCVRRVDGAVRVGRNSVRRGVTLLEILIVLALIIATAAVAIPAMTSRFENTRFDATTDQLIATLALARAEAQRQRRPVQMLWDAETSTVFAAWLDQPSDSSEDESGDPNITPEEPEGDGQAVPVRDRLSEAGIGASQLAIGGSRLRVVLPEGCRVEVGDAEIDGSGADPKSAGDPSTAGERQAGLAEPQLLSLIVYMPDGSTFGAASFRMVDRSGRQVRFDVNPWTGQAVASRERRASAGAMDESEDLISPDETASLNGEG